MYQRCTSTMYNCHNPITIATIVLFEQTLQKKSNVCFSILTPLTIYFKSAATKEIDLKNCTSGHFQS